MRDNSAKLSNLKLRIISATLIGFTFITAIFFARPLFFAIMLVIAGLMLMEWYNMTANTSHNANGSKMSKLDLANRQPSAVYLYSGLVIITVPIISILHVSDIDKNGWVLFTFFAIIWSVDSFAMFFGKTLKGPKLAPVLSPNKTVSGLIGGVLAASFVPLILAMLPFYDITRYVDVTKLTLFWHTAIIGIIAQASDLFISYFKRKFKIKDSGDIIPGHGGVLDRFDSIIFTAPVLAIYLNN